MQMRFTPRHILFAVAASAAVVCILAGCNTTGCTDNRSAIPQMGFYAMGSGDAMSLDSVEIGGGGAPNDSLLVESGKSTHIVNLPFRYDKEEVSFYIRYDYKEQGLDHPALNDTITFRYTAKPFFASEECGAMYVYTVHGFSHTSHLIDSMAVTDTLITNVDRERIQLYFRVAEDEPETPEEPEEPETPSEETAVTAAKAIKTAAR